MNFRSFAPFAVILLLVAACTKTEVDPSNEVIDKSDQKEIISISFADDANVPAGADVNVVFSGDTINLTFPAGTNLSLLVPTIQIKGISIDPASGVGQNFTQPVHYTVTAEDSSTRTYVVVAHNRAEPRTRILYFASSNHHLYAVNADNGSKIWDHYEQGGYFTYSDPIVVENTLYAGSTDGYMCAFDALTGDEKWRFFSDGRGIESPASIANGMVYFGCNNGLLYVLDTATGEQKWTYQSLGNLSTKPVFYNELVIFGSSDGNVYALNALTGAFAWKYAMGSMANQSSPALHDGVVFIGSRDTYLHAINADDGTLKWKFSDGDISMEQSSPAVYDGKVYIGSWYSIANFQLGGSVYAVDEQTGQLLWKALDNMGVSCNPYVSDGRLFIAPDDGNFYALNANNGSVLWKRMILPNGAQAIVSQNTVYVGGGGTGYFYALDAVSGDEKWEFPTPGGLMTSTPFIVE